MNIKNRITLLIAILLLCSCSFLDIRVHKGDIEYELGEAAKAYESGNYDQAEKIYSELNKSYPSLPEAHYGLGIVAYVRGDAKTAESFFRKSVAENARHYEPYFWLGNICHKRDDFDEAFKLYEQALKLAPGNPEVKKKYDELACIVKDDQKADADTLLKMGIRLYKEEKYDKAEKVFHKARSDNPGNIGVSLWLSRILVKKEMIKDAAELWKNILINADLKVFLDQYGIEANAFAEEAEGCLNTVQANDIPLLYLFLGCLYYYNTDEIGLALDYLKKGNDALPEKALAINMITATATYKLQMYNEAVAYYSKAAEADKTNPLPHLEIARIYLWKKNMKVRAKGALQIAKTLAKDDEAISREISALEGFLPPEHLVHRSREGLSIKE